MKRILTIILAMFLIGCTDITSTPITHSDPIVMDSTEGDTVIISIDPIICDTTWGVITKGDTIPIIHILDTIPEIIIPSQQLLLIFDCYPNVTYQNVTGGAFKDLNFYVPQSYFSLVCADSINLGGGVKQFKRINYTLDNISNQSENNNRISVGYTYKSGELDDASFTFMCVGHLNGSTYTGSINQELTLTVKDFVDNDPKTIDSVVVYVDTLDSKIKLR